MEDPGYDTQKKSVEGRAGKQVKVSGKHPTWRNKFLVEKSFSRSQGLKEQLLLSAKGRGRKVVLLCHSLCMVATDLW